jgi:hypothetical protein
MSDVATPVTAPVGGKSLFARFFGILMSPRDTFAEVVTRPQWLGMMILVLVVTAVFTGGFLMTQVGQTAYLDTIAEKAQQAGRTISEAEWALQEKMAPNMGYISAGSTLFIVPVMWLAISGLLFAVFNVALGGDATFKQVFAVLVHSSAITVVQQLFVTPLNYVRESMTSATNLAVFLPMLDESGFLAKFLGTLDLFMIWSVVVLAIGLSVLYRRKTGPIAIGLFVVYGIVALIVAAVTSGRAGA